MEKAQQKLDFFDSLSSPSGGAKGGALEKHHIVHKTDNHFHIDNYSR